MLPQSSREGNDAAERYRCSVIFLIGVIVGLAFGAGDQFLGSRSITLGLWASTAAQVSAVWLVLPFPPGAHGSTMAGNPLTSAAAHAYVSELLESGWAAKAEQSGAYFEARLMAALASVENVKELRRRGLMLGLAKVVGWVDRYVVDGILNVLSAWTLTAGDRLRRLQSGRAQDYVYGIALGVLLLLVWVRWPR